ncbi:MAG: hypothetical protein VB118_05300 [Oscillospiraceae bacterium]|nr:hypothetical protein [Oscillospiraceae bacterium]
MMISKSKKLLLIVSVLIILISVFSCSPKLPETLPSETTQTLSAGTNTKEAEPIETADPPKTTVLPATSTEQTCENQTDTGEPEKEKTEQQIAEEEREQAIKELNRPFTPAGICDAHLDYYNDEILQSLTYIDFVVTDEQKINEFMEYTYNVKCKGMTIDQICESTLATYEGIWYLNIPKEDFLRQ